jgi:hypothetical protein
MGYRSAVALMVYGEPEQVDMVDNLLLQKLNPEYDRDMFERQKQVIDEEVGWDDSKPKHKQRTLLWTFDDIKWYSELQGYQSDIFEWVSQIESEREDDSGLALCCEFVRIGEDNTDNEEEYSDNADYRICINRSIALPNNLTWRS